MADLATQLKQLNEAQRLRELAQQYGYGQALPQLAGQAVGQLPPAQMPQYTPPQGQLPSAAMPQVGRQPGSLPPAQMPTMPGYQAPAPSFKDIFFNPGKVMQQNYVDPALVEQMYYRGLLSR